MKTPFRREILHTKSPKGRDGDGNIHQGRKGCLENCSSDSIHHAIRNCWVNPFTTTECKPEDTRGRMPWGRVFSQASGEANVDTGDALLTLRGTECSSHTHVQLPAVVQGWVIAWFCSLRSIFFPRGVKLELWLGAASPPPPLQRLINLLSTCG